MIRRVLGRAVSPREWICYAGAFVGLFVAAHLLGWRDDVSILSGTLPTAGQGPAVAAGVAYVLLYFLAVIATPILTLATGLSWSVQRLLARRMADEPDAAGTPPPSDAVTDRAVLSRGN